MIAGGLAGTLAVGALLVLWPADPAGEPKYQYWATSLAGAVDDGLLRGLYQAVARGEVGWLDVDPKHPLPRLDARDQCDPLSCRWKLLHRQRLRPISCFRADRGSMGRHRSASIDLNDPATRKIVIEDLVAIVQQADGSTPARRDHRGSPRQRAQARCAGSGRSLQ